MHNINYLCIFLCHLIEFYAQIFLQSTMQTNAISLFTAFDISRMYRHLRFQAIKPWTSTSSSLYSCLPHVDTTTPRPSWEHIKCRQMHNIWPLSIEPTHVHSRTARSTRKSLYFCAVKPLSPPAIQYIYLYWNRIDHISYWLDCFVFACSGTTLLSLIYILFISYQFTRRICNCGPGNFFDKPLLVHFLQPSSI